MCSDMIAHPWSRTWWIKIIKWKYESDQFVNLFLPVCLNSAVWEGIGTQDYYRSLGEG